MSYIIFSHSSSNPARMGIVENECQDLVDYLNQWSSSDYIYVNLGDCGVNCKSSKYGDLNSGEKKFIKDALDELDQTKGLTQYDNVVLPHDNATWGYGRSLIHEVPSGVDVHGCTVYSGNTAIGGWEIKGMVWHEAMHSYGADHYDGRYRLNHDDYIYGITPMCMSYLYDVTGQVDTTWAGGGNVPSTFCTGNPNDTYPFKHKGNLRENHYLNILSNCTLNHA